MEFIYMIWLRIKYKFLMLHQPKKKKKKVYHSPLFAFPQPQSLQLKHLSRAITYRTHVTKYVDDKSGPTLLSAQADSKAHKKSPTCQIFSVGLFRSTFYYHKLSKIETKIFYVHTATKKWNPRIYKTLSEFSLV